MPGTSLSIRVYLCTTFRDMQAERSFLHKNVFPKITRWYAGRGITFEVVDPGWNRTEDEAEGFDHLKQALDDMERCRPFFLGLVGQRYGRGLQRVKREVLEAYPLFLKARKSMSRMYVEMLQGVLQNPEQAGGSFFYVRRADFLRQVAKEDCPLFLPATPQEGARRADLVKALRASGRPVTEYSCTWDAARKRLTSLETLAQPIADDLEKAIHQRLFPQMALNPTLSSTLFPREGAAAARLPPSPLFPVAGPVPPIAALQVVTTPAEAQPLSAKVQEAPPPIVSRPPAADAASPPPTLPPQVATLVIAAAPLPIPVTPPLPIAPSPAFTPIPLFSDQGEGGSAVPAIKDQGLEGVNLHPEQKPPDRESLTWVDGKKPDNLEVPRNARRTEAQAERWEDRLMAGTHRAGQLEKWKLWLAGCLLGFVLAAVFVFGMLIFFPGELQGWLDSLQALFH